MVAVSVWLHLATQSIAGKTDGRMNTAWRISAVKLWAGTSRGSNIMSPTVWLRAANRLIYKPRQADRCSLIQRERKGEQADIYIRRWWRFRLRITWFVSTQLAQSLTAYSSSANWTPFSLHRGRLQLPFWKHHRIWEKKIFVKMSSEKKHVFLTASA